MNENKITNIGSPTMESDANSKCYVDSLIERHTDVIRKELEQTLASKLVYDNLCEIYPTGRTDAISEISTENSFRGIPYTIFKVTGSKAKIAQIHISALNIKIGSEYINRFIFRSASTKNIKFGFANQSSTDYILTNEFELME